ncbi:hypothetical protein [Adhaeribacter radiodurans]|uniref:Uncharacterized protein n=1 Tax=Adhaeribacter radiodurans TaxID=2745197 RepID=A0A7L7L289_9BACT|nr:hypothetical protein [Adhaeribacter radiodurans]QMU26880.1 hypothetical protein HUW48_02010 [Adhaeribacter radiodurans]
MLLLFCRIITPDELVLALHAHQHTIHKQTSKTDAVKLEQKHIHCPTDHLFDSPFYSTQTPLRVQIVSFPITYQVAFASVWKFTFPNTQPHRGPPVA